MNRIEELFRNLNSLNVNTLAEEEAFRREVSKYNGNENKVQAAAIRLSVTSKPAAHSWWLLSRISNLSRDFLGRVLEIDKGQPALLWCKTVDRIKPKRPVGMMRDRSVFDSQRAPKASNVVIAI